MTDKLFNFANMPRSAIVPALVNDIVPLLADAIHDAAAEIAERECGNAATIFDVERIAGELLYSLADLLTLSPISLRGVRDLLRFHQLDGIHAAAYFDYDYTPPLELARESDHHAEGEDDDYETEEAIRPATGAHQPARDRGVIQFADVHAAAKALNLPLEQFGAAGERQKCANPDCNEWFTPVQKKQHFHSSDCRNSYWNKHRIRKSRGKVVAQ